MPAMALTTQNNRSKNRNVNKGWVFCFANKEFKHLRFFEHGKRLDSTFLYEMCRRRLDHYKFDDGAEREAKEKERY